MKALAFILVISFSSLTVKAQEYKLEFKKTTGKHGLKLKKESLAIPSFKSQNDLRQKTKSVLSHQQMDSIFMNHRVHSQIPPNTWYVIPDTRNIAPIPNVLSRLVIPEVAAIPNPLLRNRKDILNSSPFD